MLSSTYHHVLRQRSPAMLLRSRITTAATQQKSTAGLKPATSTAVLSCRVRSLHNGAVARQQQPAAAAAGQGEEGWTGGDGTDSPGAARILGIIAFSTLVGTTRSLCAAVLGRSREVVV